MVRKYTDQEIIQAFRAGGQAREKAWEFAYKDWYNLIIGAIAAKNGSREEAKEAVQEVVMVFERRVKRPDFILFHKLSTYFVTCVYRQWVRKRKRVKMTMEAFEDHHMADFIQSIEAEIVSNELAELLDKTLTRIGGRCKAILLHFMNGFSMKEIAEKLGFAGGEQVARNEKMKCQTRYETFLLEHPLILQQIQNLRNG